MDETEDLPLEADMHTVTDEEWLRAHKALMASGALPQGQLAYLYDPDRPADDVTVADLSVHPDPKEPRNG